MIKVAVTGGMGVGKSTVVEVMKQEPLFKNAMFINVDDLMKNLYENTTIRSGCYLSKVKTLLGTTDRSEVAKIIFNEPIKRKMLEFISGIEILQLLAIKFKEAEDFEFCIVEVPLLFELNMQAIFDYTICVDADMESRLERIQAQTTRVTSKEHTKRMIKAQLPQEIKTRLATFVIYNSFGMDQLKLPVSRLPKLIKGHVCLLTQ